jgi:hypothetical protein
MTGKTVSVVKGKRLPKMHVTKNYIRIRVRNPSDFIPKSFRTHDIGRKGHSKRIAGRLKSTGEWKTQAWLISKKDIIERDPTTVKLFTNILDKIIDGTY